MRCYKQRIKHIEAFGQKAEDLACHLKVWIARSAVIKNEKSVQWLFDFAFAHNF